MDKSQSALYDAYKQGDYATFKNLIDSDGLDVNIVCEDDRLLFNKVISGVCSMNISPDFFKTMLARKDLNINYMDKNNLPSVCECLRSAARCLEENGTDGNEKLTLLRNNMIASIIARDDFDPTILIKDPTSGAQNTILCQIINSSDARLVDIALDSGKFNFNEISSRGMDNSGKKFERTALEEACIKGDMKIVESLLDHGSMPTLEAIKLLSRPKVSAKAAKQENVSVSN